MQQVMIVTGGSHAGGSTLPREGSVLSAGTSCAQIGPICPTAIMAASAVCRAKRKEKRAPRRPGTA